MDDWTINTDLIRFNKALNDYAKKKKVNLHRLVKWASLGLVGDVARATPVRYGQARAGWLPFLWSLGAKAEQKSRPGENQTEARKRQHMGLRQNKFKHNLATVTEKPFAWVTNRVKHLVYLEYGVRRGEERNKPFGVARLSSVSRRNTNGFVRRAITRWTKKVREKLRST